MENGSPSPVAVRQKLGLKHEFTELNLLFEISRTLDMSIDLKDVLAPVLEKTARHMKMIRGAITILDRKTGEIFIDEAYGLSDSQKERGRYKIGEGVTGMVVKTGKPVVVPKTSDEPLFLNRTGSRAPSPPTVISILPFPPTMTCVFYPSLHP
jgi:Nif-specific regulatory protein